MRILVAVLPLVALLGCESNVVSDSGGSGGGDDDRVDLDGDGVPSGEDCNDDDPSIHPAAPERCDGVDHDCDGDPRNGFDVDRDGVASCDGDCDDTNAAVNPGAAELCDEIDHDCDSEPRNGFDEDGDGFATCEGDCDDTAADVRPSAPELCDSVDHDCDSDPVNGFDEDGDGVASCEGDCDDTNATVNPSAAELCDGIDHDCDSDPINGFDADSDGVASCEGDCDDSDASINPSAAELCDSVDHDCDSDPVNGFDLDSDGVTSCDGDCDDSDASINPSASELCDSVDHDCDSDPVNGFDLDSDGVTSCDGDCDDSDASINPSASELCDSVDHDCDSDPYNGFDADSDGVASCDGDCDDTDAAINPSATELCDSVDHDCDTDPFNGFDDDSDGVASCDGDCDDTDGSTYTGAPEQCDDVDHDCDTDPYNGLDNDNDGYLSCEDDCNDNHFGIHPGVYEIALDGVDQDCDGADFPFLDDSGAAFVSKNGLDTNPGTKAAPYLTITHALANPNGRDWVVVAEGDYDEAISVDSVGVVGGYDDAFNTYDPSATPVRLQQLATVLNGKVSMVGLTLEPTTPGPAFYQANTGREFYGADLIVNGTMETRGFINEFRNLEANGIAGSRLTFLNANVLLIEDSTLLQPDAQIALFANANTTVRNSTIVGPIRRPSGTTIIENSRLSSNGSFYGLQADRGVVYVTDTVWDYDQYAVDMNNSGAWARLFITRSHIYGNTYGGGLGTGALNLQQNVRAVIRDSVLEGTTNGGAWSYGALAFSGAEITAVNSLLRGGRSTGGSIGVGLYNGGELTLVNTILDANPAASQRIGVQISDASTTGAATIHNALFTPSVQHLGRWWGGAGNVDIDALSEFNDCSAWPFGCTSTGDSFIGDPMFVGPTNFVVQDGSVAIDNGVDPDTILASPLDEPLLDYYGNDRPLGGGWDIGPAEQ